MSFDVHWDIEKYREEHESDDHWSLRRNFMERWKPSYPEERLVCLARVFANIEFMGCRYPTEVMQEVATMSKEVNTNLTCNNDFGVNLPHSVSGGNPQDPSAGSTWLKLNSGNDFQETTYLVDFAKDPDIGVTSNALASSNALSRNPVGLSKPEDTIKTGSINGIITNPVDESEYVWDQFSTEVMQGPVSISKVLRTTYSKKLDHENSLNQNLAGNDNSTWSRNPNKNLQGTSLLSEFMNPISSQSSVQGQLYDSNCAIDLPQWQHRDPRIRQKPTITSAVTPNLTAEAYSQQHECQTITRQLVQDKHIKSDFVNTHSNSEPFSGSEDMDMRFDINVRALQDQAQDKVPLDQTEGIRNFDEIGYKPGNSEPVGISDHPDRALIAKSENRIFMPTSVVKSSDQNNTIIQEHVKCTDLIDNNGNVPSNIDIDQKSKGKKIKTKAVRKIKKSRKAKLRYQWWRQVGQKTKEEAEALCLIRLTRVPEYKELKKQTISLKQFVKNKFTKINETEGNPYKWIKTPENQSVLAISQDRSLRPTENRSQDFQDRSLEPQSVIGSHVPISENRSQVFQDKSLKLQSENCSLMPISENRSLKPISENRPAPQGRSSDQNITFFNESTNQRTVTSIDNQVNIPLKVDFNNSSGKSVVLNKKIRMNTPLPKKLKLSIELKCRYNFWLYAGRTREEALVLCQKPVNEIPEYEQIKEHTGTFRRFLKNKPVNSNNINNSKNDAIFCETPLTWTNNALTPVNPGTSYPWKLKGSAKKRYEYWIQMGKSAEEARALSQKCQRKIQRKTLQDIKKKSKRWKKLNKNMEEYKSIIMKKVVPCRHLNTNTSTTQPVKVNTINENMVVVEISDDDEKGNGQSIDDRKAPQEHSESNKDKPKLTQKLLTRLNWWMQQGKSEEEAYILCQKPMAISDAYAIIPEHKDIMDNIRHDKTQVSQSNNYATILHQEKRPQNFVPKPCENSTETENKRRFWENASEPVFKGVTKNICSSTLTHQEVIRPQITKPKLSENSTETENANKLRLLKNFETQNASQLKVCIKDVNKLICHEDYVALRDAITHCIGDDVEIKIPRCVKKCGCVIVICADERSRDWVDKQIPTLEPWEGAQLIIINEDEIPTFFCARVYIPTVPESGPLFSLEPDDLMLKLHQQNSNVGCDKWKVLNTQVQNEGLLLLVRFDNKSKDVLQSQDLKLNWYSSRPLRVKLKKNKIQNQKLAVDPPNHGNIVSNTVSAGGLSNDSNMAKIDNRANRNPYVEITAGMLTDNEGAITPTEISSFPPPMGYGIYPGQVISSHLSSLLPVKEQTSNHIHVAHMPHSEEFANASISKASRWASQSATPNISNEERHVSPYLGDTNQQELRDRTNYEHETDTGRKIDCYIGDKAGSEWSTSTRWLERRHDTDQAMEYFHQEDISMRSPDYTHRTDKIDGSEWGFDTPQLLSGHRAAIAQATQNIHRKDITEQASDYAYRLSERAGSEWGLDTPHLLPEHRAAIVRSEQYTYQENIALWAPDCTHQMDRSRSPRSRASRSSDKGRSEWGVNTSHLLPEYRVSTGQIEYTHNEDIAVRAPDHIHPKNTASDSSRREGPERAISNSLREDHALRKLRQAEQYSEQTGKPYRTEYRVDSRPDTECNRTEYRVGSTRVTERYRTEYKDARCSDISRSHPRRSGGTECYRTEYRDERCWRAKSPPSHPRVSEVQGSRPFPVAQSKRRKRPKNRKSSNRNRN